jgi:hypothetical protein
MNHADFHGGWYSVVAIAMLIPAAAKGKAAMVIQKPDASRRLLRATS